MRLLLIFFLLGLSTALLVDSPYKKQYSHIKLNIGHALFCRYTGEVIPITNKALNCTEIQEKAVMTTLSNIQASNHTVEEVLYNIQQCEAKGVILSLPVNSDTELQRSEISIADPILANEITIWSIIVNKEFGDDIFHRSETDLVTITVNEQGELLTHSSKIIRICVWVTFIAVCVLYVCIRIYFSNQMIRKRVMEKVDKRIALIPSSISTSSMTLRECSICLENFVEGERISTLPCKHTFHYKCIVPWLGSKNSCCPICKDCPYRGHDVELGFVSQSKLIEREMATRKEVFGSCSQLFVSSIVVLVICTIVL